MGRGSLPSLPLLVFGLVFQPFGSQAAAVRALQLLLVGGIDAVGVQWFGALESTPLITDHV